jgi:hypothetical protein
MLRVDGCIAFHWGAIYTEVAFKKEDGRFDQSLLRVELRHEMLRKRGMYEIVVKGK